MRDTLLYPSMRRVQTRRKSERSTSLRPEQVWCHDVLKFAGHRITIQHPRIFKTQETQPGAGKGGRSQLNSHLNFLERLGHSTDHNLDDHAPSSLTNCKMKHKFSTISHKVMILISKPLQGEYEREQVCFSRTLFQLE